MAADCKSKSRHCWRSIGFFLTGGQGWEANLLEFQAGVGKEERLKETRGLTEYQPSSEHWSAKTELWPCVAKEKWRSWGNDCLKNHAHSHMWAFRLSLGVKALLEVRIAEILRPTQCVRRWHFLRLILRSHHNSEGWNEHSGGRVESYRRATKRTEDNRF